MYKITYSAKADKSLGKIPEKLKNRLRERINTLERDPFQGKKLKGDFTGYRSIKIWPYRIIYTVNKKEITVIIVDVGHRQWIYKNL